MAGRGGLPVARVRRDLYKENGFREEEKARELIRWLQEPEPLTCQVLSVEKKKEKKNPPLLFNLAELQNECSRRFKISPDETLRIVQELYERKLATYPRTDARVLSTAVAKEIHKNHQRAYAVPGSGAVSEPDRCHGEPTKALPRPGM